MDVMEDVIYDIYTQNNHLSKFFKKKEISGKEFYYDYENILDEVYQIVKLVLENSYNFNYEFEYHEDSTVINISDINGGEKFYPIRIPNKKCGIDKKKFILNTFSYTHPTFSSFNEDNIIRELNLNKILNG